MSAVIAAVCLAAFLLYAYGGTPALAVAAAAVVGAWGGARWMRRVIGGGRR